MWISKPLGLFQSADQTENFRSLATIFPCRVVRRAAKPHRFRRGEPLPLPASLSDDRTRFSTAELLARSETAGLLVWHDGELRYERYFLGASRTTQWACFSITKSFVGTLTGIAVAEGAIRSVDDAVTDYVPLDTDVIGMVLRSATKTALSQYLHDKLWSRFGAESDAFWIVEGDGCEWTGAGLNATLRDLAKLGILYLQRGNWNGEELVPERWIRAAVTAEAPHLRPGYRETSASPFGYGYQWWLPDGSGAFCAMGVYNQFVYVDPALQLVIAKISANRRYAASDGPESFLEPEHFALFRAIGRRLA